MQAEKLCPDWLSCVVLLPLVIWGYPRGMVLLKGLLPGGFAMHGILVLPGLLLGGIIGLLLLKKNKPAMLPVILVSCIAGWLLSGSCLLNGLLFGTGLAILIVFAPFVRLFALSGIDFVKTRGKT